MGYAPARWTKINALPSKFYEVRRRDPRKPERLVSHLPAFPSRNILGAFTLLPHSLYFFGEFFCPIDDFTQRIEVIGPRGSAWKIHCAPGIYRVLGDFDVDVFAWLQLRRQFRFREFMYIHSR